jgi:hypothetical protein
MKSLKICLLLSITILAGRAVYSNNLSNKQTDTNSVEFSFIKGADVSFIPQIEDNNAHSSVAAGVEWEHQGWEGDLATGNRLLTVGNADTTLPLQFVNGWKYGGDQYEAPYTTNDSSFVVWVRVRCQGWEDFNPDA